MTTGQRNSHLQKIRIVQGDQKILEVDVGCPCHLANLCAGKVVKELSVNVPKILLLAYTINFAGVQNKKTQLREFMNFDKNEVRKVINRVSTKWISLRTCLERTLTMDT